MKKRFVIVLAFACLLGMVGCAMTQEKRETIDNADNIQVPTADKDIIETAQPTQTENTVMDESSNLPEIDFSGRYVDDLGTGYERSEMIISKQENGNYVIDFGIYKLMYIDDAIGKYNSDTNALSFEGIDIMGNAFAANIFSEDNYLSVTLLKSAYKDMPKGTVLKYYPEGYYPVEEHLK